MSINFQNIYEQIKVIGSKIQDNQMELNERRSLAIQLLLQNAGNLDWLRSKVERAREIDPGLRCAIPVHEPLDFHAPPPVLPERMTLISADGSQILPDRHKMLQYGLINVGSIVFKLNSGAAPEVVTDSHLLFDEGLYTTSGGPMTDGMLALQRDTEERTCLLDLAEKVGGDDAPIVSFSDGPIELWGKLEGEDAVEFARSLKKYLGILSGLEEKNVITAGYIDKPAADLFVRLLELSIATDDDLQKLRDFHPLRGVKDLWLFGGKQMPLLKPEERSAVFGLQSRAEKDYQGKLGLHFFYLNVSADERHPKIARVDIPGWVAEDGASLGLLHAALIQQCSLMGAHPYPYLLHRAHETAVVTRDETQQLDQLLALMVRNRGGEVGDESGKQTAKDGRGRTRYQ